MSKNRNNKSKRERQKGPARGKGKSVSSKRGRGAGRKKVLELLEGTVIMGREGYAFINIPDRDDDVFVPEKS